MGGSRFLAAALVLSGAFVAVACSHNCGGVCPKMCDREYLHRVYFPPEFRAQLDAADAPTVSGAPVATPEEDPETGFPPSTGAYPAPPPPDGQIPAPPPAATAPDGTDAGGA